MRRSGRLFQQRQADIVRLAAHRPAFRWIISALLTAIVIFAVWPVVLAHLQAIAVLNLVGQQPVPWMIGIAVSQSITNEDITLPSNVRARVYLPINKPDAPAMLVFHGVHHLGIDEPRLKAFAAALASCGFRVLTPELPNIKDYRIDATSIRTIGESTQWFASRTGHAVGVLGLSFSGSLALLAAADPTYSSSFKFIVALGSQNNMAHVAQYYLTGQETRPNGTIERLTPHEYGALVLEYEHLEDFVPSPDIEAIRQVLRQHLYEDKPSEIAAVARLTQAQAVEAKQLMDSNSLATRAALDRANTLHLSDMAGLSPSGHLASMTVPVYLLHGQADNIIPAAETLWIAHELPAPALKAVLISPVLSHLDLDGAEPGTWDQLKLIHFLALVMRAEESR